MYAGIVKPLVDRVGAVVLLFLLAPLLLGAMGAVYLTLGRPVFFAQRRPGLHGKIFTIYKLRTMDERRDEKGELLPDELRLHGAGKLIRSLSLDELPQLFNVLRGEMSFIGPRPLLEAYLPLYSKRQMHRHDVKPGITGWAQVHGRNAIRWRRKFAYDLWYVRRLSFCVDLQILFLTVKKVFVREGVSAEGRATVEPFNGHN